MANPFDAEHVLDLEWCPVSIEEDYSVTVEPVTSGFETRNLNNESPIRSFTISLGSDDPSEQVFFERLRKSFRRAKGKHQGFYLKLPEMVEPKKIPVRWDSPFRYRVMAYDNGTGQLYYEIQDLRLIEIRVD